MAHETNAATKAGHMSDTAPPPPPADRSSATSSDSATARKSLTATSKALVQEGLKPNLSAVEATSQLKVLCRKFAALTEKVKEETRVREEAEKEVRRLRVIVEGNKVPVVATCRAETQAYMKELQEAQDQLKQELRAEKAKNDKLVSKALELEKEKSALMAAAAASSSSRIHEPHTPSSSRPCVTEWDREQAGKIHETLTITIDELQDELTRKEDELASYRERLQRERSRVKTLEAQLQDQEEVAHDDRNMLKELEASIQEQRSQFEAIEMEMQLNEERLDEEATMRHTLEQQIETLNDVNAALEQRAKALVRRLELSQSMATEMDELKIQMRELEVDKETLVRSIKEVKDQHFLRETQWKGQIEQLRSEKLVLSTQISDLQNEITSLRAQNSLFSEWMLVRSENVAAAQQQQQQQPSAAYEDSESDVHRPHKPHRPQRREVDQYTSQSRARIRPLEDGMYVHTPPSCPLSPSKTRSMTTASPIKQPLRRGWQSSRRASSVSSSASSSDDIDTWVKNDSARRNAYETNHEKPPTKLSVSMASTRRNDDAGSRSSSKLSDHERLRELMSRNRELQSRLQQETVATRNLEQEISDITSQRRQ